MTSKGDSEELVLGKSVAAMSQNTEAYRFLELPKELRLMVYEYLIDRDRRTITVVQEDKKVDITLIMPSQIPKIHLACKELCVEAVPFLRKKIENLGLARTAPRLIVMGNCADFAAELVAALVDIAFNVAGITESLEESCLTLEWYHFTMLEEVWGPLAGGHRQDILAFLNNATSHLRKTNRRWWNWTDEAWLELPLRVRESPSDQDFSDFYRSSLNLATLPDASYTALSILVLGEERNGFDLEKFLGEIEDCGMHVGRIRLYVNSFKCPCLTKEYLGLVEWTYYGGDLGEEKWEKEWA